MAIARAITGTAWSARHGMARDESHQDGVANSPTANWRQRVKDNVLNFESRRGRPLIPPYGRWRWAAESTAAWRGSAAGRVVFPADTAFRIM